MRTLKEKELEERFGFSFDDLFASGGRLMEVKCENMIEALTKLTEVFRLYEKHGDKIGKLKLIAEYDPDYSALVIRNWGMPD